MKRKTLEEKFVEKVEFGDADECWLWTGAKIPYGPTGVISHKGKLLNAHRVAYKLLSGQRLSTSRGQCVLHTCLNKLCCNPNHLFIGSLSDAHRLIGVTKKRTDMRRGKHFLTTRQKRRIYQRALRGDTAATIQRDYPSIHYATVLRHVHKILQDSGVNSK